MKKIWLLTIPTISMALMPLTSCGPTNKCKINYYLDSYSPLKLSEKEQEVEKDKTWGEITKPEISASTDVEKDNVNYTFTNSTTKQEMKDSDVISADTKIKFEVTAKDAKASGLTYSDYSIPSSQQLQTTCYVPNEFLQSGSLKSGTLNALTDYTFSFNIPENTQIRYFWLMKTQSPYPLVNLYTQNFIEVKWNDTQMYYNLGYLFMDWSNGGQYLRFDTPISTGTITIKLRLLKTIENIIPAFEVLQG